MEDDKKVVIEVTMEDMIEKGVELESGKEYEIIIINNDVKNS